MKLAFYKPIADFANVRMFDLAVEDCALPN